MVVGRYLLGIFSLNLEYTILGMIYFNTTVSGGRLPKSPRKKCPVIKKSDSGIVGILWFMIL